ncbi:MAG TPA: S8 family serine peptidase, partial [Candidatus Dojkabacteria bacterium]|nr:S8 family serine peptidase [Candidatus Dojkabacteria bacterium]
MNKLVKRIFSIVTLVFMLSNIVLTLDLNHEKVLAASDNRVVAGVQTDNSKNQIVQELKAGRKIDFTKTLIKNNPEGVKGKYVLFVKKNKVSSVTRSLNNASQYFVTKDYGEVVPVPLQFNDKVNIDNELAKLSSNPDVLGISQVVKRTPSSVPIPDDPKYPNGDFSNTKQWYLNAPSGGNYGIDVYNAWSYLDSQGKAYNGASDLIVAVVDTGVAYQDFSKYGSYNLMSSPTAWDFTKSPDGTDNLFVNTNEIADNQTDDDNNGFVSDTFNTVFNQPYCIDVNSNGQCDSPAERTKGYIDDRNGLDLTDFSNYWYPYGVVAAPNCSNAPYTGYKCVTQRNCNVTSQPNYDYVGCYASDMGHPNDMFGHGTVVANIISEKVNNATSGSGIASGIRLLPIRIFGYQYIYNPAESQMEWTLTGGDSLSTALSIQYAVDRGAKIVNMSFGGSQADPFEELVMDSAYFDHNMLLVASSGNTGNSTPQYPAAYDSVMAVGSLNKNGTKSAYSTYGSFMDLVAPVDNGVPVESYTCYFTNSCMGTNEDPESPSQFSLFSNSLLTSGTSFASPQVSAVAALVWTANPALTASQVRYILDRSAIPISSRFNTLVGYGVLNAYNAVRAIDYLGNPINSKNLVVEGTRNSSGNVATRYSFNGGDSWSSWDSSMATSDEVSTIYDVNGNHTAQAIRSGTGLYFRNGLIQNGALVWGSWVKLGSTSSAPKL